MVRAFVTVRETLAQALTVLSPTLRVPLRETLLEPGTFQLDGLAASDAGHADDLKRQARDRRDACSQHR